MLSCLPARQQFVLLCCCLCSQQAAGLPLKRKLGECRVRKDAIMPAAALTVSVLCCAFQLQAAGLPLKRKLWECRVSDDAIMPPGTLIGAAHFKAGQYLDITGGEGPMLSRAVNALQ